MKSTEILYQTSERDSLIQETQYASVKGIITKDERNERLLQIEIEFREIVRKILDE